MMNQKENYRINTSFLLSFLPGSDFIFYYSLQDEETHVFCARFQTIVDLGAIKLLKK